MGLKRLFAFLRSFKANAVGIFGKFEWFAKGFIDAGTGRFSAWNRRFHRRPRALRRHRNRAFTMTERPQERGQLRFRCLGILNRTKLADEGLHLLVLHNQQGIDTQIVVFAWDVGFLIEAAQGMS